MNSQHFTTAVALGLSAAAWMPVMVRAQAAPAAVRTQAPAAAAAPAPKAQPTTSDTYLQGYLTMLEGDRLQKSKDYVGAYAKYRDARDTFDAVHAGDPGWNVEIIDYRRRKIRESMEEVRRLEVERRAAGGEPSSLGALGNSKAEPKPAAPAVKELPPEAENSRAPKNPSALMEERMKSLYAQITRLEKRNEQILKESGAREAELLKMGQERLNSQASEKALKQRLIDAETKLETAGAAEKRKHQDLVKKVNELQSALNEANAKLTKANEGLDQMKAVVDAVREENRKLIAERESLTKEREQLLALMGSGEGMRSLEKSKIVEENQRLKKELAAAQQKMTQLSAEKATDRKEIAALKDQVRSVQESLTAMQQENEDYRLQIATLTRKLDATNKALADTGTASAIPESEAIAENSVLREIILQQLKQQARRERARQNIMDELTREGVFDKMKELGVESENLLRSVNEMAAPVLLSKDQRDILSSTQVNKLLTSSDGKELYMIDESADDTPAPNKPAPSTGAEDKAGLPTELKAYANAAEEHFATGDYSSAETNFRKILLVEPQNVYALCNLGVTQLRLNNNDEAAETLLKALAYNYDIEFPHYARGVALLRLGRFEDAVEELQDALKINEKNAAAWHTLGLISIKRGQREQAKAHFLKAVEMDTNCAEAHFNLAVIYATSDPIQIDLVRRHYKMAINSGAARDSGLDKLLGMR